MSRVCSWSIIAVVTALALAPAMMVASDEWQLLGTQRVRTNAQRGVITSSAQDGHFTAIQIEAAEGTPEMLGIKVIFGNGEIFSPDTRQVFREGQRSQVIDLPGGSRMIRRIEFSFHNANPDGDVTIQVFGRRANDAGRPGRAVG